MYQPPSVSHFIGPDIQIKGQVLTQVNKFKYLDSIVTIKKQSRWGTRYINIKYFQDLWRTEEASLDQQRPIYKN